MKGGLRHWHRVSAILIGLFLILHIGNHLAGLGGQERHIAYMAWARPYYRNALVEPLLLILLAWQIASGLFMAARNWKSRRGGVAWLQVVSGLYLSFFLLIHVVAVMVGRGFLRLDTDFRFAAAGFHVSHWEYFFAPYYFLGVASLFTHVGCALYWNLPPSLANRRRLALGAPMILGCVLALAIVLSLAGAFHPVDIPPDYRATYSIKP